jgi:anthranilate 1,2-dioxygenase large subunit
MRNWTDLTWPAEDFSRVPFGVFQDREVFDQEQERVFRGPIWCYLALDAEIPNPGDYKTAFIGDTQVVAVRGAAGKVTAFVNSCAHRGTQVVRHLHGNAKDFKCSYHHWCYDLEGNLIGVPFLRGHKGKGGMPRDFNMREHGLQKLRVDGYNGVLFCSFRHHIEPLADYLDAPMRDYIDRLIPRPIEILGYMRQRIPGNWKLYLENVKDPNHAGLLHQFQTTFGLYRNTQDGASIFDKKRRHEIHYSTLDTDDAETRDEGYAGVSAFNPDLKLQDTSVLDYEDEIGDHRAICMMSVFPNAFFQQLSNSLATRQVRPRSPGEFELYWTFFGFKGDSAKVREMRLRQINMVGPAGVVSMEDGEIGRLVQLGIRGERRRHSVLEMGGTGPIENQDTPLTEVPARGFWRYYAELMGYAPMKSAAE